MSPDRIKISHPARRTDATAAGLSLLIVTASVGAGHDRPVHLMAARFRQRGGRVVVVDLVDLMILGRALRATFRTVLTHRPQWSGTLHESSDTREVGSAVSPTSI
ncbi:MAG: hypothetical protein WKF57_09440 [Nakamurella sp.]